MRNSTDLHTLIHSLDKSEKGYFKKFAKMYSRQGDQQYIQLFDAIDAQETYDEIRLVRKLRYDRNSKQLSVAKGYLWDMILRSLRSYRSTSSKYQRIHGYLENGEILFEKGFYTEAMEDWARAYDLAVQYDEWPYVLMVESWRRRYFVDLRADQWDINVLPSFERSAQTLQLQESLLKVQQVYFELLKYIKTYPDLRNTEHRAYWDAVMKRPELQPELAPDHFYGQLYFSYIHSIYHQLSFHAEECITWIRRIVQLWLDHPEMIKAEPVRYVAAVNNYLSALGKFGQFDDFIAYVDSFVAPPLHTISQKAIYFEHWWQWKEIVFKLRSDREGFAAFLEETYPELLRYQPYFNRVRWMVIRLAIANHWYTGQAYLKALELVEAILEEKEIDLRKDIQALARIYYLMLHYDLSNTLLLESISRSAKRYLQQHDRLFDTERAFLRHFNRLLHLADPNDAKQVFLDMLKDIEDLFQSNQQERFSFENIPLMEWIRKHIE